MTSKERILEATLELAINDGLGSVSLSQIADKVGIKKQSLYNHYESKAELISALYEYIRNRAKSKVNTTSIDYGELVKGKRPEDILMYAVMNYRKMNEDNSMEMFYKFILSERSIHKEAAMIMISETEKMILATKQLFYAMQAQHVMEFENVDMAAFSYTMTIHSIIDYIGDQRTAGVDRDTEKLLAEYIKDFCSVYSR